MKSFELNKDTKIDLSILTSVQKKPAAEIKCGDKKRFIEYLKKEGVIKDSKLSHIATLYGVDVYEDECMPKNHVAAFVDGQLVSLIEIA